MKRWEVEKIQQRVKEALPEGRVVPRHNERGHFYEVLDGKFPAPPIYPSVTGKLQILKDEGLMNYKMNKVLEYMFAHWKEFNEENIMQHLESAERVPADNLSDAGDIGTRCHDYREQIFKDWIASGKQPNDFLSYIPEVEKDVRAISAMRALKKFVIERDYIPVACEVLVYSHTMKVAGTLDDIGLMKQVIRPGEKECDGERIIDAKGYIRCLKCDIKERYQFVLMDLKTSNAFKDHYFFQVALYWDMFRELTGIKPERAFILKLSKEDGTYKIEDLKRPAKIAQYARTMVKTHEGIEFIKSLRKDNQRTVAPIMQL